MPDTQNGLARLIERLKAASFTGRLELRLERGAVVAAEVHTALANSEFADKPLPGIEGKQEPEFKLTAK